METIAKEDSTLMKRRKFIQSSMMALGTSALPLARSKPVDDRSRALPRRGGSLTTIQAPLAIAMWDYSWLLRHHRGGEFADWDRALDGLAERGYNALRIDCFPHLVAAGKTGERQEEFFHPKGDWKPALWGNPYSMYSRPRESLIAFLTKCRKRGIRVGLATWFLAHGTERNRDVQGLDDFVRVWDETLTIIDKNGLLDGILYVDLLNEYPLWHGFEWLERTLDSMADTPKKADGNADIPNGNPALSKGIKYNPRQKAFYENFLNEVIGRLRAKWPNLDFFASLTIDDQVLWEEMDISRFAALDAHVWFVNYDPFTRETGYMKIHMLENDLSFEKTYRAMKEYWRDHRQEMTGWMDQEIGKRAEVARKHRIPCGNTEGWGPVFWMEHPLLDWEWTKEACEAAVDLAVKHGYRFICTSNFTHPQFRTLWDDVEWHKRLTSKIKKG